MSNKVMQFEGDIRLFQLDIVTAVKTAINPDPTDLYGNIPVEASGSIFSYTAGDERTVKSKRRQRYNAVIYSDQDPGVSSISLTLVAIPAAILARMFYGDAAITAVSAGTATAEVVVLGALGVPVKLAHRYLTNTPAAPVVKSADDATTYDVGADYTIDLSRGLITPKAGGSITANSTVHVTYTYVAYELVDIRGGVKPTENFYITGDMLNRPDQSDIDIEIYQANLSNDGDVDLFSSDPITVTLKGNLVTPEGKTESYRVKQYTKAA